jgi:hypothetical protein
MSGRLRKVGEVAGPLRGDLLHVRVTWDPRTDLKHLPRPAEINIVTRCGNQRQICHFIHQPQHEPTWQRDAGWNVEWVGRKPDTFVYVGCKPVRSRRLSGRAPSTMVNYRSVERLMRSHHRGWSTHLASKRYRLA